MSSVERIKKPPLPSHLLYALSLIAIITLSSLTALLFLQNQSLQKDSENKTLTQLSWMAGDVSSKIHVFTGEYYSEIWDITHTELYPDNASKVNAIQGICQRIDTVAQQTYYDFWVDMGRIKNLDSQTNHAIYQNVSETVRIALGQVDQLRYNTQVEALELPTLLSQLYNITGLNSDTWNSGLNGIAYSFSLLSDWWQSEANGQSHGWVPPPQTSLNFALANATELYGQLTTWSSYRNPLDYDFSLGLP
jgi:hypothetical protein